jgi:hypothetical protein
MLLALLTSFESGTAVAIEPTESIDSLLFDSPTEDVVESTTTLAPTTTPTASPIPTTLTFTPTRIPTEIAATATATDISPTLESSPTNPPAPTEVASLPEFAPDALTLELTETFTTSDESFSFMHPAGWTVSGAGGIIIITGDEYRIVLTLAAESDSTPADVLLSRSDSITETDVSKFTLGADNAASATVNPGETMVVRRLNAETVAVMTVFGDYDRIAPTVLALLEGLTLR